MSRRGAVWATRWALAGIVPALIASGCRERDPQPGTATAPPTVVIVTAQNRDVPVFHEFIGQTEATRRVEIRARVPGFVIAREYREGGTVTEGQVLFRLDPRPFQADLDVAQADLDQAVAEVAAAESDLARFAELLEADAGSRKEYDDAAARLATAVARVRGAEAKIARGRLELGYTEIRSPLSGVAGAAQRDVGAYVDGNADSLLVEVIETDPIDVLFTVSERQIETTRRARKEGRIRLPPDDRVTLELMLVDGVVYPHTGSISFADIQVDPITGSTRVRGEFPNPDGTLRPGQFVRGRVTGIVRPDAVTVPRQAVVQSPSGVAVMVVDDAGIVQPRPVRLGEWIDTEVVVLSGLSAGDRVIVDGIQRVGPGVRVTVTAAPLTPPRPSGSEASNRP